MSVVGKFVLLREESIALVVGAAVVVVVAKDDKSRILAMIASDLNSNQCACLKWDDGVIVDE